MHIEEVVNRFDNVRESGGGQYSCRCPSHKDKSNSLGIKQDGERILMNCFAGCDVKSILDAVGLQWKDILPKNEEMGGLINKSFNPYSVLKMLADEVLIVGLSSAQISKGNLLSEEDHIRLLKAVSNIRGAYEKCK
jgi:hypothetical protein